MFGRGTGRVVLSVFLSGGMLLIASPPAGAVTVSEVQMGLAASPDPGSPTAGPDGNVWFTDNGAVGRITPAGAITEYRQGIPSGDTPADSITVGADGVLWFCLDGASPAIGRIDPATGTITDSPLMSNPRSVMEGPDGNVWFIGGAGLGTPAIGYVTPAGVVTEIKTGFTVAMPSVEALAAGPDGNMWFLDDGSSYAVGHVSLASKPYTLSETTSGVDQTEVLGNITGGPDGREWFTASGAIGKITLPSGTITEIQQGTDGLQSGAEPDEIMVGPDQNLWFDDQYAGNFAIGKIVPSSSSITEYALKTQTTPWTMTFGSDSNAYVVQTGRVAQVTTGGHDTEFPTSSSMSGMDGDVMVEGPDGNVYYNDLGTPRALIQVNLNERPAVHTGAASALTASSATVAGSVTPLSADTTVSVHYGTTTALGSTVAAASLKASTNPSVVTATLTGLPASTTIFYELVATNANGTVSGGIQSFTTAAASTSPPSVTTARTGDQLLSLTIPSMQTCTAASRKLSVTFTTKRVPRARTHLHLSRVTFTIDKGVTHHHQVTIRQHGGVHTVTITTHSPNAIAHASPASVHLALSGLVRGVHTLIVRATYSQTVGQGRHRHQRLTSKTLSVRFRVC
jgi:virginiamycin B lyase